MNGEDPQINLNVSIVDHLPQGLQGFKVILTNWGTGEMLAESDLPTDGSAIAIQTPAFGPGAGKLTLRGPATQQHWRLRNYEQFFSLNMTKDHTVEFVLENCPDIDDDAHTPPVIATAMPPDLEESELAEEPARAAKDYSLGCHTISVSVENRLDPGKEYQARMSLHGRDWLCDTKTLVAGITGVHVASFSIRETSMTTYFHVWPTDAPSEGWVLVLTGHKKVRNPKITITGAFTKIYCG